jgi:hypothetical protein
MGSEAVKKSVLAERCPLVCQSKWSLRMLEGDIEGLV